MGKKFRGEVLYNPEDDLHYSTLTVGETLRFALKTKSPDKKSLGEGITKQQYIQEFLRVVSKLFWIEHTLDTQVGDDIVRGVSGGEKKRVSIAEAMVTQASTQCWDNSTKGLDASTAVEYVSSIRAQTNSVKIATMVALYQAGEQLYDLFDKVILIHEGRCLYFGRSENAKSYFEGLGFYCPPRWTTADFLTSVSDLQGRHVKPGWEDRIPRTTESLELAYRNSDHYQNNIRDIEAFEASLREQQESAVRAPQIASKSQNYNNSFLEQAVACVSRQFKVVLGNPFVIYGKWAGVTFQSLVVGSLFFDLKATAPGVYPRGGLMFFTLLFSALLALSEVAAVYGSRPILMKHKSFSFYTPSAYGIALVALDIPFCFVQVSIISIIVYFMTNLQRTASDFFFFFLVVFLSSVTMNSFFRMLGCITSGLDVASRITGVAVQAIVVYNGYLIPPSAMHPWFSWIRWINPMQYAFEAVMINEFHNLEIDCVPPFLVPSVGPGVSPEHQSCSIRGSKPGSTIVNGADYIRTEYGYIPSHRWRDVGTVLAFWVLFVILTIIGLELQKPYKGGASVTVFKRGQTPVKVEKAIDGQSSAPTDEEAQAKDTTAMNTTSRASEARSQVARNNTILTWQNVTYTIETKTGTRTLLNNVQGYVKPGKLTALMGESGAGKTTLLNTLAQRITFGTVTGTFLVDGKPLPVSFQRSTGFAEQQDVHEPTTTVREALRFSALLRQPRSVPVQEKYDYVEKIIELLEMEGIAGAIIGSPGNGLNQEQRKLVTIGVELASKPQLLMFFDEPTSGLDSAAAFHVVRFLRTLADLGQIVLCTIHQPSAVLFEYFDDLILLKKGGKVVYHGPLGQDSQTMINYFENSGGRHCRAGENPAEYMLDVIGAGDPNRKERDWGEVWIESTEHGERTDEIACLIEERQKSNGEGTLLIESTRFAMPWTSQFMAVVGRTFKSYWRSPSYINGIFVVHIFTALFNSFTFYKLGSTLTAMQSRLFTLFLTLTTAPALVQQLQPRFLEMRSLFQARENKASIYHWTAALIAIIVVEIPYRIVAATLYFVCWYFPVGFPRDTFSMGYAWIWLVAFQLYYLGIGQAIAAICPNIIVASTIFPIIFLFVVLFCGVVVPPASIIKFWRWMYHISPFTHLLEGILGVVTHNQPVQCADKEFAVVTPPTNLTCSDYLSDFVQLAGGYFDQQQSSSGDGVECRYCQYKNGDEYAASFNIFYSHRWSSYLISWGFILLNFVHVFLFLWLYLGGFGRLRRRMRTTR